MKRYMGIAIVALLVAGMAWYAMSAGWFSGPVIPNNPPTAEEIERMEDIERTANEIAPNAKPGAGVFAPGTLPPPPAPSTTTEAVASTTETL
jgi:hypothetical protein